MNYTLLLILILGFLTLGGGSYYVYTQKRSGDNTEWIIKEQCKPITGNCGKGNTLLEKKCDKLFGCTAVFAKQNCYIPCDKPVEVIDWGHSNDSSTVPKNAPQKGWYDVSGQGRPGDYCRWVGEKGKSFWACQTAEEPYMKADPEHILFSAGPSNKLNRPTDVSVRKTCPFDNSYLLAADPDLQKSITNGFIGQCSSRCVYDYRNPKTGWTFDGQNWTRIPDMKTHKCHTDNPQDLKDSIKRYEQLYDVKNAWIF